MQGIRLSDKADKGYTMKRGNRQGTAYRRGYTWTGVRPGYSYTEIKDGKPHLIRRRPTKGGFKTKKEALQWAMSDNDDIKQPKLIELWQSYEENELKKLSENKQCAYRIARKRIEPLMAKQIDHITLAEIQNIINQKCKTYYPAKDIKDLLSNLYQKAMASNTSLVKQNLAKYVILPELQEKEQNPFTEDEVKAIWKLYDAGDKIAGFILLMIYTGMMPGELMALDKSMIDNGKLEIRGAGKKTKTRKSAVIVYPELLKSVIDNLMQYDPTSDKLYPVNKDNFYEYYYACLERANVRKLKPYSCRHTFGTEIVKAGIHPAAVQKLMRHSNMKTQEKYTHLTADDQHEAISGWLTNG